MEPVVERQVEIRKASGLHLRPVSELVELVKGFASQITLEKEGRTAEAGSIIAVLSLGVEQGSKITVRARGSDAARAVEAISSFLQGEEERISDHGED